MKKFILSLLLVLFSLPNVFAQLPNSNMSLLANRNQHASGMGGGYSAIWGYKADNGREYAILGCNSGTAFIDVTDSTNIIERDFLPGLSSGWREMKVYSHYAYIVSEAVGSGLQIVDLQYLPDSVHLVSVYTYTGYTKTHSISQSGPYLYLHGGNNTMGGSDPGGLTILDITNPTAPVKRGQWSNFYVHDSRIIGDTIYACNIYNPPGTVSVINATNKDNLQTISSWVNNPNPFPHNIALDKTRRYAYTTDETSTPNGKLKVWDLQNIMSPTFVTSWMPTGITTAIVHNVEIYGDYAVIAHYRAGIRMLNISVPTAPVEVAWYDTYPSSNSNSFSGCWGVYMFPSGKIIASDINTGLYVVKPTIALTGISGVSNTAPEKYSLNQNYPNPFNPVTKISFSVPQNSQVKLQVFNIAGQSVAELVNDRRDAGTYDVTFDAAKYGLTSGAYFYKLTAGDYSETKKMVLVK
jgi:choice-of-anchor B domain-containing protein